MTTPRVATVSTLHEIFTGENDLPSVCVDVVIFASHNHEDTYVSRSKRRTFSMGKISREFSSTKADFKKLKSREIAVDGESGECTV